MKNYKDFKKKLLKNEAIQKAYKQLGPEFSLVEMIIDQRLKQGITQQQLAKKIGSKQPVISRLEQGTYNPSVKFLKRVAAALNAELVISIS
jgi:ribosome-binding protein aMBF1 (putative translation factor)